MPRNQPASLTSDEYLNLVAYILQANKFPAGETALTADTALLTSTFIAAEVSKAAAAPQPITTGTLVQVIGCLQQSGSDWRLTQASAPVRTENPTRRRPTSGPRLDAGRHTTLQLLGSTPHPTSTRASAWKVGFIVKDPAGDRLNVVSLEMVAPSCGGRRSADVAHNSLNGRRFQPGQPCGGAASDQYV